MLGAYESAEAPAGSHVGAQLKAQQTANLVVQLVGSVFPGLDGFQIGLRQMIFIIYIGRAGEHAIRPGAVFEVEAIAYGLVGIVASAPVADHDSVETPLPLQDIHEDALVVAEVFILI